MGAGLLGAVLLLVAEPLTLYTVSTPGRAAPVAVASQTAGAHHAFALVPIALLAGLLVFTGARRGGGRLALLAVGALGACALLIALLVDLPDAHSHGITRGFLPAAATPGVALYLETLGALLLILVAGLGLTLLTPPRGSAPTAPRVTPN